MKENKSLMVRGDSSLDKIRAYYANPSKHELSPTLEEIRMRLVEAYGLIMNYWPRQRIAHKWEVDKGLSQAQAYLDIKNAQLLFGQVNKLDRDSKRNLLFEYSSNLLERARKKGDLKAESKAIELMIKCSGLSEEDIAQFNPEKFENVEVAIAIPKALQEVLIAKMQGGTVDLNKFDATEIDYEELKEEDDDSQE